MTVGEQNAAGFTPNNLLTHVTASTMIKLLRASVIIQPKLLSS